MKKMKVFSAILLLSVCVVNSMQLSVRPTIPRGVNPLSDKMVEYINNLNTMAPELTVLKMM